MIISIDKYAKRYLFETAFVKKNAILIENFLFSFSENKRLEKKYLTIFIGYLYG